MACKAKAPDFRTTLALQCGATRLLLMAGWMGEVPPHLTREHGIQGPWVSYGGCSSQKPVVLQEPQSSIAYWPLYTKALDGLLGEDATKLMAVAAIKSVLYLMTTGGE